MGLNLKHQKVLIVEDHPTVRFALKAVLSKKSWEVVGAFDTILEAFDFAQKESWTMGIFDIHLKDGNGLQLLQDIRRLNLNQPIIVHGEVPDSTIAARVLKVGGNGYLNKESHLDEVKKALRTLAKGETYVNPKFAGDIINKAVSKQGGFSELSNRELQVMKLLAEGFSQPEIAEKLGVSVNSLSSYRSRILKKLNIKSTVDIIRYAFREQIVDLRANP